jgi:hypothetical protein
MAKRMVAGSDEIPGFDRLAINAHYRVPEDCDNRLIILCTYMDAPVRIIRSYAAKYASQFPKAKVLLLTTTFYDMAFPSKAIRGIGPALDTILPRLDTHTAMHAAVYSNGGTQSLIHFAKLYKDRTGRPLTLKCIVFDSTPSVPDLEAGYHTIYPNLPPIFRSGALSYITPHLLWATIATIVFGSRVVGYRDRFADIQRDIIDTLLFTPGGKRVYIFGSADKVSPWRTIEASASQAEMWWNVRLERFDHSGHVAHEKEDRARYWRIVRAAFESQPPVESDLDAGRAKYLARL